MDSGRQFTVLAGIVALRKLLTNVFRDYDRSPFSTNTDGHSGLSMTNYTTELMFKNCFFILKIV